MEEVVEVPEIITQTYLDALTKVLKPGHLYYIQEKVVGSNRGKIREKIEGQVPELSEILGDMTRNEYFGQTLDFEGFPPLTFRSIPSWAPEEAADFARKNSDTENNYNRIYSRRRLAYALMSIGDNYVGVAPIEGSYADIRIAGSAKDLKDKINENASARYDELAAKPDLLVSRLSDIFAAWDLILFDRIHGMDANEVKN